MNAMRLFLHISAGSFTERGPMSNQPANKPP